MKQFCLIFLLILFNLSFAFGQTGEIQGNVTDAKTGEAIPFTNVSITINGTLVGAQTDFDGFYSIKSIPVGSYDVSVSYIGYQPQIILGVLIKEDETIFLNTQLNEETNFMSLVHFMSLEHEKKREQLKNRKNIKENGTLEEKKYEKV